MEIPNPANWNKIKVVLVLLFFILFSISVFFNFRPGPILITESDKEVQRLRAVRDSSLNFALNSSLDRTKLAEKKVIVYKTKDSIIEFNLKQYEKIIPKFSPSQRKHLTDSLFRAAGIAR